MRTIYGQTSSATTDPSSAGAARARRLCAGLVVAGALFGSAAPARADDGLAVDGLSGGSIAATVATVQAAAVGQAAAIVDQAVSAAAASPQPASAPAPSDPQTGSASGVAGGISSDPPTAPTQTGAQPATARPAAPPAPAATTAGVVAPSAPVVSQPPAADTPPASSPDTTAVPSAALHRLAREYQQNPARYHSLNSLPISHESGAVSGLQSLVKRAPFTKETATPNPTSITAPTCQGSSEQTGCGGSAPHPPHAHVGAVASSAPADPSAAPPPDAVPVDTVEASVDRVAGAVATAVHPLVRHPVTARPATPRPAATAQVEKSASAPAIHASAAPASAPRRADVDGTAPVRVDRPRSARPTVQTESAQRDSAGAGSPSQSMWPWVGLALLLAGLTSISLAVVSVGADGAAAVTALAARLRTTRPSVTGITTRMRSKGLSAGASGAVANRPHERRGIRYRD